MTMSAADFATILRALGRYGLLRFPDQLLEPAALRDFSLRFGSIQTSLTGQFQDPTHPYAIVMHIGFDAVQLAQQNGLGVYRVAGMNEILSGSDRQVVHHLKAAGNDALGNDVGHCTPGFFHAVESCQQYFGNLRFGQQFDRDLSDDPEHAFGAGEERQQVEAR